MVCIALPVFQIRALELRRLCTYLCQLLLAHGSELLGDADVVFNLADRGAAERQAVNGKAQNIGKAIFEWDRVLRSRTSGSGRRLGR